MTINELLDLWTQSGRETDVGKYEAVDADVIAGVVGRLDAIDPEAADVVRWLTWWHQHQVNGLRWRESVIGELQGVKVEATP